MRAADAALDYLLTWGDILGGELLDGIDWEETLDQSGHIVELSVLPFRIGFQVGTTLTVRLKVDADMKAFLYSFDLHQDNELCFRHDCHPGHEELGTGPYHLHVGPGLEDRRPDRAQRVQTIFEHVTTENLRRSREKPRWPAGLILRRFPTGPVSATGGR